MMSAYQDDPTAEMETYPPRLYAFVTRLGSLGVGYFQREDAPYTEYIRADLPAERIAELEARERELVEAIKSTKELAEFWISRGKPFNASEEDYRIWLALGHHSDSMTKCKNFLAKIEAQQQEKGDERTS